VAGINQRKAPYPDLMAAGETVGTLQRRADLRAVEDCPRELQPLAELQYRAALFTQKNARDWTPAALLQNRLGIRVGEDAVTREALARALPEVLEEPVLSLRANSPPRAAYLD
jgi:hypothetical protein